MRRIGLAALLAVVCACGSSTTMQMQGATGDMAQATITPSGDMATAMMNGSTDMATMIMASGDMAMMMGGGGIPDPGAGGNGPYFDDVMGKANNTPETAIPLGPLTGPTVAIWVTDNTIKAGATDYFVFLAHDNGTIQPGIGMQGICGAPLVLTKIDVWKVVNHQQQTPAIAEWKPAAATPNCITGSAPVVAGTTYLVGFTAGASGGNYQV